MVPNTLMTHVGVHEQQIWPSLVTNPISISQHLGRLQLVTPLIARQPRIVLCPMWYNIIPSFVPMDLNIYSMYYSKIKGLDPLIFGRKKGFVTNVTQPKLVLLVKQFTSRNPPPPLLQLCFQLLFNYKQSWKIHI